MKLWNFCHGIFTGHVYNFLALILLIVILIVLFVHYKKNKKRDEENEDELSELKAELTNEKELLEKKGYVRTEVSEEK